MLTSSAPPAGPPPPNSMPCPPSSLRSPPPPAPISTTSTASKNPVSPPNISSWKTASRPAAIPSFPASGIAIWHVDELGDRDNQSLANNSVHANYELTLVQADNLWHFQNNLNAGDSRDLYYAGNPAAGYVNQFTRYDCPQRPLVGRLHFRPRLRRLLAPAIPT